jgi:hypothetical protein
MTSNQEIPTNLEQQADTILDEIFAAGMLPPECTVHNMDESGMPKHNPLLRRVLEKFGTSPKGSYQTEAKATHAPAKNRDSIATFYKDLIEFVRSPRNGVTQLKRQYPVEPYFKDGDPAYNPRLHILVLSHTTKASPWGERSRKIMSILGKSYAPTLKYNFNATRGDEVGDFHALVGWMYEHFEDLDNLYYEQKDLPHLAAKIAKGVRVTPKLAEVKKLISNWEPRFGGVNLEAARVDKIKGLDATIAPKFPRPGSTSITSAFERLFVNLDPRNLDDVRRALNEPDLANEEATYFTKNLNNLQLLMFSLLGDVQDPSREAILPQLDQISGNRIKPGAVTRAILDLAYSEQVGKSSQNLKAIDVRFSMSLENAIEIVSKQLNLSPYPGFGAARALLVQHTNLYLSNDPRADDLEKLMFYMVEMAEGRQDNFLSPPEEG